MMRIIDRIAAAHNATGLVDKGPFNNEIGGV